MKPLKEKLDDLEKQKYIRKITEPTEWVSNLVIVTKKNGQLRLCIDPTNLNRAIRRQHFQTPSLDEITCKLSKAKYFSLLDAKDGFWQVPLTEEASKLTCFSTPFERYCWNVMPFGIKSAPEVYQQRMS